MSTCHDESDPATQVGLYIQKASEAYNRETGCEIEERPKME